MEHFLGVLMNFGLIPNSSLRRKLDTLVMRNTLESYSVSRSSSKSLELPSELELSLSEELTRPGISSSCSTYLVVWVGASCLCVEEVLVFALLESF